MKKVLRGGALVSATALVLAACSTTDDTEPSASAASVDYKACMVSDAGGFDDKSFNQAGFAGLEQARDELGIEIATAESSSGDDYAPNIDALVADGCDMIITVGFLLGDATAEAAAANPDVNFAIIDFAYDEPIDNVKPLLFNTNEAAFLAGYAAAGDTATGTVATFGGIPIPPVTVFMDGFLAGVNYYNEENGTEVAVLGWDGTDGSFSGGFEDQTVGQSITEGFIEQGADIVLPVAGPVGLGAAAAAEEAGIQIIGVDSDWSETAPEYIDVIYTSILKNMQPAVFDVISETATGEGFSNAPYLGTLENGGVGVAALDTDVSAIEAGIIDGTIDAG